MSSGASAQVTAKSTKSTAATPAKSSTPARAKQTGSANGNASGEAKKVQSKAVAAAKEANATSQESTLDSLAAGRGKRTHRMSGAMKASIEAAKSLQTTTVDGVKSPPRKVPKLEAGATPGSHSTPGHSKSKSSHSKKSSSDASSITTPPASARAARSATPSSSAPTAATTSTPAVAAMPPPAAPVEVKSHEPKLWITSPNPNGYVVFRPAHSTPSLTPAGYALAGPPLPPPPPPPPAPVALPAPPTEQGETEVKSENAMDISTEPPTTGPNASTDSKSELTSSSTAVSATTSNTTAETAAPLPPPAPATPPPPPLPQYHPNLPALQKMYASGQPIHFSRGGSAMAPHMRQHPTCPGYTPAQAARCQNPYAETNTLGFSAHYKKHVAESAKFAQQGRVFIIDNGAYAVKMGFSSEANPDIIHNMVGKPKAAKKKFTGAELGIVHGAYAPLAPSATNKNSRGPSSSSSSTLSSSSHSNASKIDAASICSDFRSLSITRPHDRGYVLNWDLQTQIWALDQVFRRRHTNIVSAPAKRGSAAANISAATASTLASTGDPADIPDADSHCLILTEAHLSPKNLNQKLVEHIFGTLRFGSLFVCSPSFLAMIHHRYAYSYTADSGRVLISQGERGDDSDPAHNPPLPAPLQNPCCMVVEVGYSFSHCTPFFDDFKMNYAIKRLGVGGKMLTNYLRELVSFRHFNMMDQTYLMSLIKERLCYVSTSVQADLKASRLRNNTIKKHYILPDQTNSILGFVYGTTPTAADLGPKAAAAREAAMKVDHGPAGGATSSNNSDSLKAAADAVPEDAQVLSLCNERFAVPEMLFHPSDVQMKEAGLAEMVWQSIMACPEYLREAFCANIVLIGASSALPGLADRLLQELRPLLPTQYTLRIYVPSSPGTFAWHGGRYLATHRAEWLDSVAVSKAEFQESGMHIPKHRFALY